MSTTKVKTVYTDWHQSVNFNPKTKSCDIEYVYRDNNKTCFGPEWKVKKIKCRDIDYHILVKQYIFKEQVYFERYTRDSKLCWIPLLQSNGTNMVNISNASLLSANLISQHPYEQPPTAPVVYPDYSKVDVGDGIQWPSKVFAPFCDSTAWPPYKIGDIYATTQVPFYNLGFIVSQNPNLCLPSWGTYYPAEAGPLNDQIKKLRDLGGDVTVSFGGAANVPLHVTAPDVNSLFEQYKRFVEAYKLTRIDFDLEGIWISPSYSEDTDRNNKALKLLQDYMASQSKTIAVWYTLPILPTGLTQDGINVLQNALDNGVIIGGVNVMTMDYGDSAAPNPAGRMGEYGIQAITSLKNQLNTLYGGSKSEAELWAMIGTTPMIGVNDVQDEIFAQSDANQTLNFGNTINLGMISMWSSNRDSQSKSGIPQNDNEFALIFNAYN